MGSCVMKPGTEMAKPGESAVVSMEAVEFYRMEQLYVKMLFCRY